MKRYINPFLILLACFGYTQLHALNRDYTYQHKDGLEDHYYPYGYYGSTDMLLPRCLIDCLYDNIGQPPYYSYDNDQGCYYYSNYPGQIEYHLLELIPATGPECYCRGCHRNSIYFGYVDSAFNKYSAHLKHHLEYYRQHQECSCLWPEYSQEAAQISDMAYLLNQNCI